MAIAICQCGHRSRTFLTNGTINKDIYTECLKKRLLLFRQYAKSTLKILHYNNIDTVPKDANPPNVPELRPIERYWALVKRELKKDKNPVKNKQSFKVKWNRSSSKITENVIKNLMYDIQGKFKNFFKK